jgi:hypothetical protein
MSSKGVFCRRAALFLVILCAGAPRVLAVPMTFAVAIPDPNHPGQTIHPVVTGAARWPNGTTINVYIQTDPNAGGTRHLRIQEGVQRWATELAGRGVALNVQIGAPPANATNAVVVRWVPPGSLGNDSAGNAQDGVGHAQAHFVGDGHGGFRADRIVSGDISIDSGATGDDLLRNLGMHEFGHALGFADEPTQPNQPHNAMDHQVSATAAQAFSAADIAELNAVYGTAAGQRPRATVTGTAGQTSSLRWDYQYTVSYVDGPDIPFIQIDPFGGIFDLLLPEGWRLVDPANPATLVDYMEDCSTSFDSPLSTDRTALTFITNTDPLGPNDPVANISFSSFWGPTEALAYAMDDDFSTVLVPSDKFTLIPEPATFSLFGAALLGLGAGRKRRRRIASGE